MSKKTPHDKAVCDAAEALSDLNTFAICVSILEGGHLHSASYAGAGRIIKICQDEQRKRLDEYDRAIALSKSARKHGDGGE